jgi:hypothetical protein
MDNNKTTLNINDTVIHFNVTTTAHERLIDEMKADSKVVPMHNFLMRTVDAESKEALAPFLKNPSSTMEIGGKVLEEFSPKLRITVGE